MASKQRLSLLERLKRVKEAGLSRSKPLWKQIPDAEDPDNPEQRAQRLTQFIHLMQEAPVLKPGHTLAFVLYDIEDNRVRRYVAKYLENKGYMRVQKSVFFGHVPLGLHREVGEALKEVNACYANGDSILIVPVSRDMFHNLKLIGRNLSMELGMGFKNTLFV